MTVKGGAAGVKDVAGNALAADESAGRSRPRSPPGPGPDEGPGGPVLVIAKASNPFTRYYAEILRAEGLNAFKVTDIANVTPAVLASYDAAILGDMALTAAQVSMLTTWVNGGGDLIAMRPDKQLAGLLGLTDQGTTLANAYLRVDTSQAPGAGIVSATMQFHGAADRYALAGATAVATLYSNASTATTAPAVTMRSVGTNGGRAAAFTYDLARSVVLTRQGNPGLGRPGPRRPGADPLRRPVLRRHDGRQPARLGRPLEGRDPAGRRAAAAAREPARDDDAGQEAAAALLVLPARRSRPW